MKITNYFKENWAEMKNVHWPSKKDIITFTGIVILISFFVAFLLGFFDFVFSTALQKIIL